MSLKRQLRNGYARNGRCTSSSILPTEDSLASDVVIAHEEIFANFSPIILLWAAKEHRRYGSAWQERFAQFVAVAFRRRMFRENIAVRRAVDCTWSI